MDTNPIPHLKDVATRRRTRQSSMQRLALTATELADVEVARLSRGNRLATAEAEQVRGFLRAGGGVVAHR
jgi:hypothetical protein